MSSIRVRLLSVALIALGATTGLLASAANAPTRARHGMVVSQEVIASDVGAAVLEDGGNAIDAAIATAFALAVTHPSAGNVAGGGFIVYRPATGDPVVYDFRETAPAAARPDMWLVDGKYDFQRHHFSHLSVGVPGTVAGLHMAWKEHGKLPWRRLVEPAIRLASRGFKVSDGLATSLQQTLPRFKDHPASLAQFSRAGVAYAPGETLQQPDLAATLRRIAAQGPDGFYKGRTADLIVQEMQRNGGLITHADLESYVAVKRAPLRGSYRGYEVLTLPPPSSSVAVLEMLNILEGYDLRGSGFGSTATLHAMAESMRRAFADRARYLGDPAFNADLPIQRLASKEYAAGLRATIDPKAASRSKPDSFEWRKESPETTHLSAVDAARNAVSLTYTLEWTYGSGIVVPGGGFLLNNEMGDFNAGPGLTDERGLIGTPPNLAAPGKRMLSSMSPAILSKDGALFMVTGSPGGRTIINTVLQTILNVVDHGMNAQAAVDAGRVHHQWLPDTLVYEKHGFSIDSLNGLRAMGHRLTEREAQGAAQVIVLNAADQVLEGGADRRDPDSAAVGY
jgi:gamma-glutamyltranspeptidase / glutathione hydrolase